jgi:hypothetical protein
MANGQHAMIDVLSNEQLDEPSSLEIFRHKHLVVENCRFQLCKFDSFGLKRLFPLGTDLPFIGMWNIYVDVTQLSTIHVDHTQEDEKDAQGTLQHLLDSDKALNGNIVSTRRVSVSPSDYPPPDSLGSDVAAWNFTLEEPYCKRRIRLPERHTRWITAATSNAFGVWTEEALGFCAYLNVVNGLLWVLISKPKGQGGRNFAHISNAATSFDPVASNSGLWNVESVLLHEGSQL